MKCVGYFLLLCGLATSPVWGQAAPKNETLVVRRCGPLSCSSSEPAVIRTAKRKLILATFKSFQGTEPSITRRANPEVKLGTFKSFPTVRSGIRTAKREVKLGTFPSNLSAHRPLASLTTGERRENGNASRKDRTHFPKPPL